MRKHAELIKAWAEGAKIQVRYENGVEWNDIDIPRWADHLDYRLKPKEDGDLTCYYYINANTSIYKATDADSADLKVVFDEKTHQVKKILIKNPKWSASNPNSTEQTEIPLLSTSIMDKYIRKKS